MKRRTQIVLRGGAKINKYILQVTESKIIFSLMFFFYSPCY